LRWVFGLIPLLGATAQAQTASITESISGTTVKINLVPIPAGKTTIADPADPKKTTEVAIGPIYMSKTEVTWDQYDIFVYRLDEPDPATAAANADASTHPSKPYISMDRSFGHTGYAAIGMSFRGAEEFCNWLSTKTGHKYRIATEAEWEYAAHAGKPGDYPDGVDASKLSNIAWFKDDAEEKTHPVASKKPNAWGLFDMAGNAAEWVLGADGKPVVKGGSYKESPDGLKISGRVKQSAAWNASDPQIPKSKWWLADCTFVGFRIVREPDGTVVPTPPPNPANPKPVPPPPPPKGRQDDHPVPK
jgi:formylglycine-generating enzyme required for sulfatase activity